MTSFPLRLMRRIGLKPRTPYEHLKTSPRFEEKTVELFALNIMKAGESFFENPMETPFIPTWNRVLSAIPDFLDRFKESVELDNAELEK